MNKSVIDEQNSENRRVIEKMVAGYAAQNLDAIMPLFSQDAVYHDIQGLSMWGKTLNGRAEIRKHFTFYFDYLMPKHTYKDSIIFVEGDRVCASWTLVLGANLPEQKQFHIRGYDYFLIKDGKVQEKCAFIKVNLLMLIAITRMRLKEMFQTITSPAFRPGNSV